MQVSDTEASAVDSGIKKFLLIKHDETLHTKEIRSLNGVCFVAIVEYEAGTLDHWLHDKKLLQDYGFAQPHEFVDYLKSKYGKINDDQQIWARVEVVRVPEWSETPTKDIKQGLFKLLFRLKTENRV